MKTLITLLILITPTLSLASPDCKNNPIFCDILKLKPRINKEFAMTLSNYIYKYSKQFGTDPAISVAIAMQESSFENKNRKGSLINKDGKIVHGITDIGVFQIHVNTIAGLKKDGHDLDTERLKADIEYQTYWHTKILKKKISVCKSKSHKLKVDPGNEWSCYHSYTFNQRKIYLNLVQAHLTKLDF